MTSSACIDPPRVYSQQSTIFFTKPTVYSWPILSENIHRCREVDGALVNIAKVSRDKGHSILTQRRGRTAHILID